ncbi:MAG: maleylpyruvate isomerase family mycothiol-dependent enzyme [Micrococcales bacterium]|nr:maleylpyruvate isomerase family mycothiol-dependent enzyme [Micrococcales bacterium]
MSAIHPVLNPARVRSDLSRLGRESEQYLSTVESFHDDEFDKPSHCEGWNRAMVIAHVAVAARRLTRLLDWAQTGEEQQLFESKDERTELLEQLAAKPREELKAESRAALEAFIADAEVLTGELTAEEVGIGPKRFPATSIPAVLIAEVVVHHADLDTQWEVEEADPDSLLNAVTAGVLNLSVKDSPGLTIVTDEGDEWVVGDGSLRVEGDREGILDWLSRGRTEGIYLPEGVDEAPELPAW